MNVHKWMINSVHYSYENNNCITVNTTLIYTYILKRTRLTPKITTANCHVIYKQESFKWPEYFPLCEDTPISFIIIHDGIKHVVVNRKIGIIGSKNRSIFRQCSQHKTPLTLKTTWNISFKVNITKNWRFVL